MTATMPSRRIGDRNTSEVNVRAMPAGSADPAGFEHERVQFAVLGQDAVHGGDEIAAGNPRHDGVVAVLAFGVDQAGLPEP